MRVKILGERPGRWLAIVVVLALFVGYGYARYRNGSGDDLASSYVGSRLLLDGLPGHLFHYDPVSFAEIGEDDVWTVVAKQGDFYGYLHPYVQTPLWAYALEPLAKSLRFPIFNRVFLFFTMLSFAGGLWLTAKYWARSFFNPVAIAVVIVLLCLSQPFQYAMYLNQTHMLIVFLTLAALVLAEKDRPIAGGALLACAAAVKITPALLVLYWLITGRWRAVVSTALSSALLWGLTLMAVGEPLAHVYLANLHRISRVLLLSQNNQSLAATIMQHFYPFDEVFDISIFPLPTFIRLLSSGLMVLCTAWGGWVDRKRREMSAGQAQPVAPLGAMIAMVAATMFAPIAWTHYAILLVVPFMMLVDRMQHVRARWVWVLIGMALVLNYQPLATDIVNGEIGTFSIVRGQFYSCVLVLVALMAVAWMEMRKAERTPVAMESAGVVAA